MFSGRGAHTKVRRNKNGAFIARARLEILEDRLAPGATFDGITPTPIVFSHPHTGRVLDQEPEAPSKAVGLVDPLAAGAGSNELDVLETTRTHRVKRELLATRDDFPTNKNTEADGALSAGMDITGPAQSRDHPNTNVGPIGAASFLGAGPLIGSRLAVSGERVHQISVPSSTVPIAFAGVARPEAPENRSVSFKFAVMGSYGFAGQPEADVAGLINSWAPDFIITPGDSNYPDGEASTIVQNVGQYFCPYIHNPDAPAGQVCNSGLATSKFFPAPGDDDWDNLTGSPLSPYLNYFTLPAGPGGERYYDFVKGPIHFFAIDGDQREPAGTTFNSTQAGWLKAGLAAATEPWKIVYVHHDPYSSADFHGSTPDMQWPFQEWGASAVISGHDHTYERIMKNGSFPYFVNGLGGHPTKYNFLSPPVDGSVVRYNGDWGAMLVQGDESAMTFQFITRTGAVIDSHTITHTANLIVPAGASWKYHDQGANLGQRWRRINFGDAGWASGPAQLGYGDADELTVVNYGPDPSNKYITTFFRYKFTVPDPSIYNGLDIHLLYDDGAVVYLNATEIMRKHMPLGPINYLTLADAAVSGDEENLYTVDSISVANLKPGTNVLAVEVHQVIASSADISFDLALFGTTA